MFSNQNSFSESKNKLYSRTDCTYIHIHTSGVIIAPWWRSRGGVVSLTCGETLFTQAGGPGCDLRWRAAVGCEARVPQWFVVNSALTQRWLPERTTLGWCQTPVANHRSPWRGPAHDPWQRTRCAHRIRTPHGTTLMVNTLLTRFPRRVRG